MIKTNYINETINILEGNVWGWNREEDGEGQSNYDQNPEGNHNFYITKVTVRWIKRQKYMLRETVQVIEL